MAAIRNLSECPYYDQKHWRRVDLDAQLARYMTKSRFPHVYPKLAAEILANTRAKSLTECLEELNRTDDARTILDHEVCYHDVFAVKFLVAKPIFAQHDVLIKHDCLRIVMKILERFLAAPVDLDAAEIVTTKSVDTPSLNDRRVITCYNVLSIVNELVYKSLEMSLYFSSSPMLFELLGRFVSPEFVCKTSTSTSGGGGGGGGLSFSKKRLLTLAINNIYLLTRHYDDLDLDLGPLELVEKLLVLVRILRQQQQLSEIRAEPEIREIILNSLYCVANLIDDGRIESLERDELEFAMSRLLAQLESIVDQIEWNELRKSNVRAASGALTGSLVVLTRLAVNPMVREMIFVKHSLLRRVVFR